MNGEAADRFGDPIVSVIVPCYDVAEYVDECIQSVFAQRAVSLEIIAVDDGSTDGTRDRLASLARSDDRVVVITQPNSGLGAARNVGVDSARGRYLTFLDSDDCLPERALERMVAVADASSSDLVTGVAERFDSTGRWRVAPYGPFFDKDRLGCHVSRNPDLIYDQMACSKLFSSDFWKRTGLRFPEGVLYEDVSVVVQAQWEAVRVAVVKDTVYLWRRRERGELSITQDRYRPGSAAARFAALERADQYLRGAATAIVWAEHGVKICTVDLRIYVRLLDGAPPGWSTELLEAAGPVLDSLSPETQSRLNWPTRLICAAVRRRDQWAAQTAVGLLSTSDGRSTVRSMLALANLLVRRPAMLLSIFNRSR